jgi:macrophage erythroblast attacher
MAELRNVKISPESHFLLDQPLLRLPYELSRNNFRTAHRQLEQNQTKVLELIDAGVTNAALDPSGATTVANLDDAIARLKKLKRKLETLDEVQNALSNQLGARIEHMDQLYHIPTLADVAYEDWSKVRLNRLLVDYLCRSGYTKSARELAESKDILALVDLEEWETVGRIDQSLREERRVDLVLAWCGENKANLKKISVRLVLPFLCMTTTNVVLEQLGVRITTTTAR